MTNKHSKIGHFLIETSVPHSPKNIRLNLFHSQLRDMLDSNDSLIALAADTIN